MFYTKINKNQEEEIKEQKKVSSVEQVGMKAEKSVRRFVVRVCLMNELKLSAGPVVRDHYDVIPSPCVTMPRCIVCVCVCVIF